MALESQISHGAIAKIFTTNDTSSRPIVQICEIKKITPPNPKSNPNAPPRYRLAISDGDHFQQAMLATQLNALINQGQIQVFSLVRLNDFICNKLQNKRILIILNLDVIATLPNKIGNPIGIDTAMANRLAGQENATPNAPPFAAPPAPTSTIPSNVTPQNQPHQPRQQFSVQKPGPGAFGGAAWNAPARTNYPFAMGSSGVMSTVNSTPSSIYRPIQTINPYQNGWTIRGRCTYKGELRKFHNHRGDGLVISFELTDESGSIRITGFTQHAQTVEDTVHFNRMYKVSRGSLRQANERWNRSTSQFEMTLDRNSVLEEVDDDGSFMQVKYNFTKISDLENLDVKAECDVVGVVIKIGPLSEIIVRSTGEPCSRRSITITDDSGRCVEMTLWRKQAETFLTETDLDRHPIVVLRKASRGDFGGTSLNVNHLTTLELDPVNVQEANKLRNWYDTVGCNASEVQSITSTPGAGGKIVGTRKSLEDAKTEDVDPVFSGGSGSGDSATFVTRAYVGFVNSKNDIFYPSDPETKKKLTDAGPGMWSSESTNATYSDEEVVWRYVLSMKVMDHSSSTWVSGFDEVGQALLGKTAQEFRAMKESDPSLAEQIIEESTFRPMVMKVTVRERMWREEQQIRYTVTRAEPVNFAQEGRMLLKEIESHGVM